METTKKVYDFSFDQVRTQVTAALRKNGNRGTVADVVAASGLPKYQVETVLPAVVGDCRGQMAVTESGEILYHFPHGVSNPEKSLGKKVLRGLGKVLAALFKVWIMVMLVGYFVLFLLILLLALVLSIALSFMRRDDDGDGAAIGGFVGGMMVARVLEFFLLLWMFSGDSEYRVRKTKKPFYKAVFEFVFGVEDRPTVRAKMERKAAISLIREKKGTVSIEELMALTGKDRARADAFVSQLLLEYEGEPRVSDQGTLNFFFPELLKTSINTGRTYELPDQELIPANRNPAKTNNWIIGFNAFNLVFGAYYLSYGLMGVDSLARNSDNLSILYQLSLILTAGFGGMSLEAANGWLTLILGVIPAVYSAFFFGIPLVRRWQEGKRNFQIKADNLRRKIVSAILGKPTEIRLDQVQPSGEDNAPGKPGPAREALKEQMLRDLAGPRNVEVLGTEPLVFSVPDLEREKTDLEEVRKKTDLSKLALGKVVFNTED